MNMIWYDMIDVSILIWLMCLSSYDWCVYPHMIASLYLLCLPFYGRHDEYKYEYDDDDDDDDDDNDWYQCPYYNVLRREYMCMVSIWMVPRGTWVRARCVRAHRRSCSRCYQSSSCQLSQRRRRRLSLATAVTVPLDPMIVQSISTRLVRIGTSYSPSS